MEDIMNRRFSIGFSGDLQELDRLIHTSDKIQTVYTGGIENIIAGGRPQYSKTYQEIEKAVDLARKHGVGFEIALNAPCGIEDSTNKVWWDMVRKYLKELEHCGVTGIIASHPFIMNAVKSVTQMKLVASTICEIHSSRSALYYERIGADVVVPSMSCNYDLETLKSISRSLQQATLRLMVNEHCLGDCPWRRFHHSHYAHSNEELDYHMKCKKVYWDNPHLLLTNSVIRPEDVERYEGITQNFKIVGRQLPIEVLIDNVKAYDQGYWDGNYVALFDQKMAEKIMIPNERLNTLFALKSSCKTECHQCNACKDLYCSAVS